MELDELRDLWQTQDRKLDAVLAASRRADRREGAAPVQSHLDRLGRRILMAMGLDAAALLWIGSFIGEHLREPRFLVPAALLHLCAIAGFVATLHQWIALRQVDLGEPVLGIQRRLERLRRLRLAEIRGVIAISPLIWLPMLIIAMKGFMGLDAYALFSGVWMISNLAFGLVFLLAAVWASRRYAERVQESSRLQRLMRTLAGSNLAAATDALRRLEAFEHGNGEDL